MTNPVQSNPKTTIVALLVAIAAVSTATANWLQTGALPDFSTLTVTLLTAFGFLWAKDHNK